MANDSKAAGGTAQAFEPPEQFAAKAHLDARGYETM